MTSEKGKKILERKLCLAVLFFFLGIVIGVAAVTLPSWVRKWNNKAKKTADTRGYDATKIVKLGDYQGIKVSLAPTEEELQTEIDSFLEENTTYEQLKGTASENDKIHATISATVEGKEIDSAAVDDYIDLGAGLYLYEIENAFVGMKTGETKTLKIKVPNAYYGDDIIDGKEAGFHLTLDYICGEAIIPDYNDEFVAAVTNYHSVAEYNEYLKQRLKKENEEDKKENAWTLVLEKSEIDDGDYPSSLLKQQKKEILQGYYDMATINGTSRDEVFQEFGCKDEQDFIDTELEGLAKDAAKDILVSEAIAVKENIYYTQKEYDAILNEEYENNKDLYQSKKEYIKKNKDYLENTALMESVKTWIDAHADYVAEETPDIGSTGNPEKK